MRFALSLFIVFVFSAWHNHVRATDPVISKDVIPTASFTATTVCQGLYTQFTNNSSTQSGSIVASIWDFGDGNGSSVLNPKHTYTNAGTYSVTLTVINSEGDVDDFSAPVTVHPSGDLNFLISSVNQCESSEFAFSNLSNIVSGSFTSHEWDFGDGSPTAGAADAAHTYGTNGTYTIVLTTLTDQNCTNSFSKTMEVFPEADVDFLGQNVCLGTGVQFTNTTQVASGLVSYTWAFGDTETSAEINPVHSYAEAGDYTVVLTATTEKGCVTNTSKGVTTFPMPVASFTVSDHCFGNDAAFTNQSTIDDGTMSYTWTFGDGNSSTSENPVHGYDAIGNFLVTLTAESDHGCEAGFEKYLFVSARPVVNFSFKNICFGEQAEFFNNSTIAEGEVTYEWDFGDGASSQNINPVHSYETFGTFNVTLEATTPQGGCSGSLVKEIVVNQQPVALFEAKNNCLDSMIVFNNMSVFQGNDITYHWDFGNGKTGADKNPTHQYGNAQIYTVMLKAEALNGCSHTLTKPVEVYPMPVVSFTAENVCDTEDVTFRNLTSIASGTMSYQWNFGDQNFSTDVEPEHLYASHGNYNVEVTVTSGFGCTVIKQKPVSVYPLPVTDFEAPAVCDSKPIVFQNQSSIASGEIAEYLWDFGDQTNAIVKNPTKGYLKDGTYTVKLISTSDRGCKTNIQKDVTVYPPPIANFNVADVCTEESIQTENTSFISSGSLSYYWDFGDNNNSVAASPSHNYSNYGVYNILLVATADTGCKDSVYHAVAIFNKPEINAGPDQSVSQGYPAQLIALGGSEYTWEPIDGLNNSGIANPIATPLATTTYVVFAKDNNGCQNSDTVTVTVEEEFKLVASNVLTPDANGVNDTWQINNVETFGDVHVRVYDRWGKLVFEQQAYQNDWRGTTGKDILPDGAYYYFVTFGSSDKVYKGAITILRNK